MSTTPEQRKSNVRLGLILLSVACAVLAGFVAKILLLNT
ncbi:cytochrome oxidase small assembly protein [Limnohabitans sp. Rim8]|nr:cytochrome oxidase small assembly protein [Limnohabitans sp. Rim8]